MARITVEDCLENLSNRFELIMLATKRSRDLLRGSRESLVDWENDKATVVALREIAAGHIDTNYLKQEDTPVDDPDSAALLVPTQDSQDTV